MNMPGEVSKNPEHVCKSVETLTNHKQYLNRSKLSAS